MACFFDEKMKRSKAMMKGKRKGCWLGRWHFFLVVLRYSIQGSPHWLLNSLRNMHRIQEVKQEEAASETLPELEGDKGATNRRRTGVCRGSYHKSRRVL